MRIARLARCDALFSDELPRARLVDHPDLAILVFSSDLHMTGEKEVHFGRSVTLFDEIGTGRKPLDVDKVGRVSERGCSHVRRPTVLGRSPACP